MISFEVKDMTCGHCVRAITEAVHSVDRGADLRIDLAAHRVDITPGQADAATLRAAIAEAGYSPVALAGEVEAAKAGRDPARGCCGQGNSCCG